MGYGMGTAAFSGNVNIQAGTMLDTALGLNTETDAFGNQTIVTVAAGATLDDSWGNGEALGGIAGGGDILMPVSYGMSGWSACFDDFLRPHSRGAINSAGARAGTGSAEFHASRRREHHADRHRQRLRRPNPITNGTIIVSANVLPGQTGPLGQANSAVLVGNTTGNSNATLLADTPGVQIGRDVQLQSGNTGISTIGGTNTSGTVYYTGNIILGLATTAATAAMPLTVTAAAGGTVEIDGPIIRGYGVTGSADSLTKIGAGTLVLTGNNTYQGGTVLAAGTSGVGQRQQRLGTGSGTLTLNGGTLAAGAMRRHDQRSGAGRQRPAYRRSGRGPARRAVRPSSLWGGLTTNANTTLAFNLGAPLSGGNYSGDLVRTWVAHR